MIIVSNIQRVDRNRKLVTNIHLEEKSLAKRMK
jgi:hypothetical protein